MLSKCNQPTTGSQFEYNQVAQARGDIGGSFCRRRRRRASDFVVVGGQIKHRSGRFGGEQPPRGSWGCGLLAEKRQRLFSQAQRSMREQCELLMVSVLR